MKPLPESITTDRLAQIRARLAAATPGPWPTGQWDTRPYARAGFPYSTFAIGPQHGCPADPSNEPAKRQYAEAAAKRDADATFIAAAPTDLADLLAEVDRLTAQLADEQGKRRAADAVLAEIGGWCITHGAALKPGGGNADTFGDGMRAAKDQIRRVLFRNLNPSAGESR